MLDGPRKATPFYYQLDQLGTPQELTDYSGEIMWSAKYRAYGNLAALDVSEIDNPLRFQGQYFDTESGLHYNRHRYYNPGTGRFLTPDPIKLVGGLNGYQYVPNPTGWVDPLGLNCTPGQCPDAVPPKWTENSVFNKYPKKTVIKTSGPEEQAAFLQEHLPGLPKEQAQMILEQSYKKGTSVVIGGSRVRGDSHPGSDLDVGFGDVNANKAGKILKDLKKSFEGKEGFLSLEETKIAPGNKTASIEEIKSPEEFFQRSGKRSEQDQKAGEAYRPSGSITLKEDGTITLIPPGELP